MKAVIYEEYGAPNVLKIGDIPKPEIKKNEVLVAVKASGVNPVDTYFRKGVREVDSFPFVPHLDLAGEIVEVGEDVTNVKVGERIWATNAKGASAEYVALDSNIVFPLTDEQSYVEGAALAMPFMTAHLSLFYRGDLKAGETVLIYGGSGAVGHAAIQLAKNAGAYVISTAGSVDKAEIAKNAGADEVILYKDEDLVSRVSTLTNGNGVQLILDMSVSENLEKDLEMISVGGRIVTIGSPVNNTPTLPWRLLNAKLASLLGILQLTVPVDVLAEAGINISAGFTNNKLSSHIGRVFPYGEAAAAHELIELKSINGRIILNHEI